MTTDLSFPHFVLRSGEDTVSEVNPLPVTLPSAVIAALEAGVLGGASGGLSGGVTQMGIWTVGLSGSLPAGSNNIGSVSISNLPAVQPVSIAGTISTAGTMSIVGTVATTGTVSISNFPTIQSVSGTVSLAGTPSITGSVAISNLPSVQPVSGTVSLSGVVATSGTVVISNFPGTQPVSVVGTLTVRDTAAETSLATIAANTSGTLSVTGGVAVMNFPTIQTVSGTVTANGTVTIANLPNTQTVAGSVTVSNFPTLQAVHDTAVSDTLSDISSALAGTLTTAGTVSISGTVDTAGTVVVSNLPSIQTVDGTVSLAGTSTITGAVSVTNFPTTQVVQDVAAEASLASIATALAGTLTTSGTVVVSGTVQDTAAETSLSNIETALAGTLSVAGSVAVTNYPTLQVVQDVDAETSLASIATALAGTLITAGTIAVSNYPSIQVVQDIAAENSLAAISTALAGTITTAGTVSLSGVSLVQDLSAEAALAAIASGIVSIAASDAPSTGYWTTLLESTQAIQTAVERAWAPEDDTPLTVQFDSVSPPLIAGMTQDGNVKAIGVDRQGGARPADADIPYIGSSSSVSNSPILVRFLTRGFNSVSIAITGTFVGTITFQVSQDQSSWFSIGAINSNPGAAPVTTTTTTGLWLIPTFGLYFQAIFTAYTSGTAIATAYLRNENLPLLMATPTVLASQSGSPWGMNITQINSAAIAGTNLAGVPPVGGPTAVGAAPSVYPVTVGGVDTGGLTRRLLTDTTGALVVDGVDVNGIPRRLLTDASGILPQPRDGDSGLTTPELLRLVVIELRILSHLLASDRSAGDPEDLRSSADFASFVN